MRTIARAALTAGLLGLLVTATGCAPGPDGVGPDGVGADGVGTAAAATRAVLAGIDPAGPGCSISVGRDGAVVFGDARGTADLARGVPIDATTAFDIASVGKQFTGTVVLLLEAEGALSVDDRVGRWVPGLPAWAGGITVEHLLHHTSGLPDYVEPLLAAGARLTDPTTNADVLDALRTAPPPTAPPGTAHLYSNTNYVLLAEVAEAASGTAFPELVADRVAAPLGLGIRVDPAGGPGRATGYDRGGGPGPWTAVDVAWGQVGDGAVVSTTADLVRWSTQYWRPTLHGPEVNDRRLAGAVPTGLDLFGGLRYGAGVFTGTLPDGRTVIGHEGQWGGFRTSWVVVPQARLAVAVSCNADGLLEAEVPAADVLGLWLAAPTAATPVP